MIAALELERRTERAWAALAYMLLQAAVALAGIAALAVVALGAVLAPLGVGLPLLLGGAEACRRLLGADRRSANHLLDAGIPPLPARRRRRPGATAWARSLALLGDRALWRLVVALALKPLLAVALLAGAAVPLTVLAELLLLGVQALTGGGGFDYVGPLAFGPAAGIVLLALVPVAAVLVIAALEGLGAVAACADSALLAPRAAAGAPVREMLAESLGDHSVAIAYWLPEQQVFVDEVGHRVELPERGSGRAWTAVERDGRRVAAIVHDASLDTTPELVHAAATASSLALDNERLKADLRARLEELRVSRLRIVEATDEARRRIERDLHDGAQQQLVALALELRLLRGRVGDAETRELVDGLSERLAVALEELRELARGIHPAILTDRGLAPAIEALCDRAAVAADCEVAVDERLPAAIESAAYFVVAEGLTNVAKHAPDAGAQIEVRREADALVVVVADDGPGGATDAAAGDGGSGLRGLQDRLAAVDGTLAVECPPGGGTVLRARIPAPRRTADERQAQEAGA